MDTIKKVINGRTLLTVLFISLGGFYLFPLGNVTGGWVYVKDDPTLTIHPTPIPNKRGVEVTIAGAGFAPNEELGLRVMMGGVMSDIRHQVKPTPKVNRHGAFASDWKLGREIRLFKPGAYSLMAVNEEGEVLAQAPFVVDEPEKKDKKKK